jgi:hypothetical protein
MKLSTDIRACQKLSVLLNRTIAGAILTGSVMAMQVAADEGCNAPTVPKMPDGKRASMEQMLAGQKAVKAFQESNMDYMHCLERKYTAAKAHAKSSKSAEERASANAEYRTSIDAYNAAVSSEESVAGGFNIELREYKAANR